MKKRDFWNEIKQYELLPYRAAVGQEIEGVMVARFAESVKVVGPATASRTVDRAIEDRVQIPTSAPLS